MNEQMLEEATIKAHEAQRAYHNSVGVITLPIWEELSAAEQELARSRARSILERTTTLPQPTARMVGIDVFISVARSASKRFQNT